jgi:hypothetical protein
MSRIEKKSDVPSTHLKAKLTQLMRNTMMAKQNTPSRAYIPISRSERPLVTTLFSPVPGTSTWAG